MIPGYHTQNLVSELYRITETVSKQISTSNSGFAWLSKYKSSGRKSIIFSCFHETYRNGRVKMELKHFLSCENVINFIKTHKTLLSGVTPCLIHN